VSIARRFPPRPEAVPAARRFVRETLGDCSRDVIEAAELLTSELATNCVLHAHSDFELAIDPGGEIRVEVSDTGPGQPRLLSPGSRDLTGRGLRIVETMSADWGVRRNRRGKTVWFTLAPSDGHPSGTTR
jgi:anti-sigma regulatory factor (Ser/Thr protein kinase)